MSQLPSSARLSCRRAESFLWMLALVALSYWAFVFLEARGYQAYWSRELMHAQHAGTPRAQPPVRGSALGRVEIPRLGLAVVILEGSDAGVLRLGVGHVAGTALPGDSGNVVLAAHRDTFFRPLRNIRKNDTIHLITPRGVRRYVVESTAVVDPDQTEVLHASPSPTLTLITCYPFHYVGPAPRRFVIRASEARRLPLV